jgi:hypothetical protein
VFRIERAWDIIRLVIHASRVQRGSPQ